MALFAIGDTHLSLGADKPMDVFRGWLDYTARLESNWRSIVKPEDTVVVAGDVSWAMKLEHTAEDFAFLHSLPGRKLLMKGNHDYWWTTKAKMDKFLAERGFDTLSILFNNAFLCDGVAVAGTRGWFYDCAEDEKLVLLRECGRLRMSLDEALKLDAAPVVFLHYPPLYGDYRCDEIMEVLHEYGVRRCFYAHLHGASHQRAVQGVREGIDFRLIASDYLDFWPCLIGAQV